MRQFRPKWCGTKPTSNAAAGPFSTQPSGPRPVGCFSALLARPVSIQIWALRSRLEKQPTDLRRHHHYMRDGTLPSRQHLCEVSIKIETPQMPPKPQSPPEPAASGPSAAAVPTLAASDVSKAFGSVAVLKSITLSFQPGEIHAIVGENGAGKTTFVKILAGMIEPTSGEIFFRGNRIEMAT